MAGRGLEFEVIAAVVIGGTSLRRPGQICGRSSA
jgi:ribose/xylose/arabinose/galactoside ABC-type transport system permease subunit